MSVQEGLDRVKLNLIQGRRVILTGASSGIGEALASRLLELEANVLVTARRESPLIKLKEKYPQQVHWVSGDITAPSTRQRLIETAQEHWGAIDLLVNNAGIGAMGPFAEASPDRLELLMKVNFIAPAELSRLAYPLLVKGEQPALMNIGSILGHRAVPWKSEYCASKFAIRGLTAA